MAITDIYSGIVVNQNAATAGSINWRHDYNAQTIYQTFYLPSNYQVGTDASEQRYPDLSGFQVMANIDVGFASTATLDYSFDFYVLGRGWSNLVTGTVIGAHSDGTAWFDIIFPRPIPVTSDMAGAFFRLGVTTRSAQAQTVAEPVTVIGPNRYLINGVGVTANLAQDLPYPVTVTGQAGFLLLHDAEVTYSVQQGVGALWYASPNPLGFKGAAYRSDGKTPLLNNGTASINFRVLSLVADAGTDFLGNNLRSCVVHHDGTTDDTTWLSPPQPSAFAVLNHYFDVRPVPGTPVLGQLNLIPNPSFEWDGLGSAPYDWQVFDGLVTREDFLVENGWAASGVQALRSTSTFKQQTVVAGTPNGPLLLFTAGAAPFSGVLGPGLGSGGFAVQPGQSFTASCVVNILALPQSSRPLQPLLLWWDAMNNFLGASSSAGFTPGSFLIPTAPGATQLGVQTLTVSASAPPQAAYGALLVVFADNAAGALDFYLDEAMVTATSTVQAYGDGDSFGWEWLGQRGRSTSAQLLPVEPGDDTTVIDGLLLDPLTPNVAFNVYYSVDDAGTGPQMTERDWEQKLWMRVPRAYVATQAQQYVFPEPIKAKYVKIEFTNLQAQTYDPGPFQQPVTYKKFPTWVADFFIAQLEQPSFVATLVNVQNDALTFAYAYYLDDLHQAPSKPVSAPSRQIARLSSFFSQSDAEGLVDAATLAQINLIMKTFQVPTGTILPGGASVLSQYATNALNQAITPNVKEVPPNFAIDYSTVSTLSREPVIFEQSLPVMFFFLTCRHTYKELSASFEFNRAYFAGVKSIAFLRHNYQTSADTPLYVESGGDTFNAEINDFVVAADGTWSIES